MSPVDQIPALDHCHPTPHLQLTEADQEARAVGVFGAEKDELAQDVIREPGGVEHRKNGERLDDGQGETLVVLQGVTKVCRA